jgi:hypothetical protein
MREIYHCILGDIQSTYTCDAHNSSRTELSLETFVWQGGRNVSVGSVGLKTDCPQKLPAFPSPNPRKTL